MYDKYEYGHPNVVLSVDGVMGLYLHMTQVQPKVTYVVILLCVMMIDICIMTMIRDYAYGDCSILCALMNYM